MSESPTRDVSLKPACINLRHKLMYVDERQETPGRVDDSSDTRVFFCKHSLDVLGKDGEPVGPRYCTPSRSCYCGIRQP